MVLGALLDLGLPLEALRDALGSLAVVHSTVSADRVLRAGVSATKFRLGAADAADAADAHAEHARRPERVHAHAGHGGSHRHRPSHRHDSARPEASTHQPHADHHSLADIAKYINRSALSAEG